MLDLIAALCAAGALLLLASSAAKLVSPDATSTMIAALVPATRRRHAWRRTAARAIGAAEAAVGLLVLGLGGRGPALLLAAAYLTFAVVAVRLVRSPRPVSCGCFGRSDAPVTGAHVALNLVVTALAVAAVVRPIPAMGGLLDDGVAVALAGPVLVGLTAWVAYLVITALPALSSARRLVETS